MSITDNRIVNMVFNNAQFESRAKTSINTLDRLKEALLFRGANKAIGSLEDRFNHFSLGGLGNTLSSIGNKFSTFEVVAITAISNITNRAVDAGIRLTKSLSIDQITAGWSKYAEKTTSVQTIMAATAETWEESARAMGFTGTQMEFVNAQLGKLNWFTDETSYNFVDMVSNIGKFTANNIPLQEAVTSMQGIANWAAISGQNAAAASRAMYNLSQAIGVGSVKLMDWRSIENANMATSEFKNKVLEVAAANGQLKKLADGTYQTLKGTAVSVENFSQTLSEGWFDKQTLLTTLDLYGGFTNALYEFSQESNLTATRILQLIEANKKGTLSQKELDKASRESGISISELKNKIADLSKEEYAFGLKAFRAAQEAKTFADAIDATKDAASTAWMNIFETIFGDYEKAKVLWTDFANFLYDVLVSPLETVRDLLDGWANPIGAIFDEVGSFNKGSSIGNALSEIFGNVGSRGLDLRAGIDLLNQYGLATDDVKQKILDLAVSHGVLKKTSNDLYITSDRQIVTFENFNDVVKDSWVTLGEFKQIINDLAVSGRDLIFGNQATGLVGAFTYLKAAIWGVEELDAAGIIPTIKEGFTEIFGELDSNILINASIAFRNFAQSLVLSEDKLSSIQSVAKGLFSILKQIGEIIGKVWESTKPLRDSLLNLAGAILKLLGNFGDFASSGDSVVKKLSPLFTFITNLSNALANFINWVSDRISGIKSSKLSGVFEFIVDTFNKVVGWLQGIWDRIKQLDLSTLFHNIIGGIESAFTNLKKFAEEHNLIDVLAKLLGLGFAGFKNFKIFEILSNLSDSTSLLGGKDSLVNKIKEIGEGITDTMSTLQNSLNADILMKLAKAIAILAVGLLILSIVDADKLIMGFATLASLMGVLIFGVKELKKIEKDVLAVSGALFMVALSMVALATALAMFSILSTFGTTVIDGLVLMALTLGIVVATIYGLGKIVKKNAKDIIAGAGTIIMISGALMILAASLLAFSLIAMLPSVGKGFLLLTGSLFIAITAMTVLGAIAKNNLPGVLAGAAALLIFSVALLALAAAIGAFALIAAMPTVGAGIVLFAGALLLLVSACLALSFISTPVLVGAAVLLALSVALGVFAGARALVGLALPVLTAGLTIFAGGITIIGDAIVTTIMKLGVSIGTVIDNVLSAINRGIEGFFEAIGTGIGNGLSAISKGITDVGDSLTSLADGIGDVGDGIERFGNGLRTLDGIKWLEIGIGMGDIASNLKKLNKNKLEFDPDVVADYITQINKLIKTFEDAIPTLENVGNRWNLALANGLKRGMNGLIAAVNAVVRTAMSTAGSYYYEWEALGQSAVDGYSQGLSSKQKSIEGATSNAIKAGIKSAKNAQQSKSPSKEFRQLGIYGGKGYALGWQDAESTIENAVRANMQAALENAMMMSQAIAAIVESDATPTIRPVLDLSQVASQARGIGGLFPSTSLNAVRSVSASSPISAVAATNQNGSAGVITNNINVYAQPGQDVNAIADKVVNKIQVSIHRKERVFA